MKPLLALLLLAGLASAADLPKVPQPKPTKPDEATVKTWSTAKAAEYLDGVGVNWTRDRQCVTCHTNMPYLFARPLLKDAPDAGWKEVRKFLEDDVTSWSNGGKPKGDAYVVATAAALAVSDARTTGKLHPATKDALDRMWTVQRKAGDWNWLKCEWPPLEHDDYYGAVLAAVAVAEAPGKYAETDQAKAGIKSLQAYFAKTPSPDLHHSAWLLWAAAKVDGLMAAGQKKGAVADLRKREAWVSTEHEKAALHNTRRLQAIVFTDVVSFSALMQANEGLTIQKVRTDLQRMQAEGKAQGGALINTMGDGMLMIFSSATQAVKFSLQMQRSFNLNSGAGGLRHGP